MSIFSTQVSMSKDKACFTKILFWDIFCDYDIFWIWHFVLFFCKKKNIKYCCSEIFSEIKTGMSVLWYIIFHATFPNLFLPLSKYWKATFLLVRLNYEFIPFCQHLGKTTIAVSSTAGIPPNIKIIKSIKKVRSQI